MSASALAYLAACGTDEPSGGGDSAEAAKVIPKGKIARRDVHGQLAGCTSTRSARAQEFQEKNGTKIKYVEEINDNTEFFGKVRLQYDQGNRVAVTSTS